MKDEKLGQQPAFPLDYTNSGMSKRFYAATKILSGIVSDANTLDAALAAFDGNDEPAYESMVKNVYKLTDELLKQENQ